MSAYIDWKELATLESGPVFRAITRWGKVSEHGFHMDSLIPLLRHIFKEAGVTNFEDYSAHSLRRGFANWASGNGWDLKTLMEYVGWKSIQNAMRYIEAADPFAQAKIESSLSLSDSMRSHRSSLPEP